MSGTLEADPVTTPSGLRESFREAMGHVAAPVSVVTTYADETPFGATVSAFASLSMEPPMLVVSLARESRLLARLEVGSAVGINVLADDQGPLARQFATPVEDRFAGVGWSLVDGAPSLAGTHAWVRLSVAQLVPGGDHVLVLGDVLDATSGDRAPLIYHRRTYGTHRPH